MTMDLPVTDTPGTNPQPLLNFIVSEQNNTESSLARFQNREMESAQSVIVKKAIILRRNNIFHEKGNRWLQILLLD